MNNKYKIISQNKDYPNTPKFFHNVDNFKNYP